MLGGEKIMAPKFKQLINQTYRGDHGATAFIGFPIDQSIKVQSVFRVLLCDEVIQITGFKHRKYTGVYEDVDVRYQFYDHKDAEIVETFFPKPGPGCLASLFETKYYRVHKTEQGRIEALIKTEIYTSHDAPGVVVSKSICVESQLAQIIEKVANDLKLRIRRSSFPYPMNAILMSNKTFDIGE